VRGPIPTYGFGVVPVKGTSQEASAIIAAIVGMAVQSRATV
jgi:hypothetical protein